MVLKDLNIDGNPILVDRQREVGDHQDTKRVKAALAGALVLATLGIGKLFYDGGARASELSNYISQACSLYKQGGFGKAYEKAYAAGYRACRELKEEDFFSRDSKLQRIVMDSKLICHAIEQAHPKSTKMTRTLVENGLVNTL